MEKKFYTRNEAAEMLNCHPQTISNLGDRGLLNLHRSNGKVVVEKDSMDRYLKTIIPAAKSLEEIESLTEKIKRECEEYNRIYTMWQVEKSVINVIEWERVAELIDEIMKLVKVGESLSDIERNVMLAVLNGWTFYSIAENEGKTKDAIVYAYKRATNKIKKYLSNFRRLVEANDGHNTQIKALLRKVAEMTEENKKLRGLLGVREARRNRIENQELKDFDKMVKLLNSRITDAYPQLSIRAEHCLNSAGIITIADLCSLSKGKVASVRSLGAKTLMELDEFLVSYGLHYSMNLSKYKLYLVHPDNNNK